MRGTRQTEPYCAHGDVSSISRRFSRLAVVKVNGDEPCETLIALDDILYFFTGAALSQRLIHASWTSGQSLRSDRLYARTAKSHFLTYARTLAELQQRLDSGRFLAIHQSLIINIHKVTELDLRDKLKQVGFALGSGAPKEWLTVSRRNQGDYWLVITGAIVFPQALCETAADGTSFIATIVGTEGDDIINGTPGDDIIAALGENDIVYGFSGNDIICGGNGDDILWV